VIGRLHGILIEKQPPEILIECHGVGYEVTMPMTSFYSLPEIDQTTIIYTHFVVREDAQLLYGFANKTERKLFRLLIKVNGVGPKLALAILSGMSAEQFVEAVMRDDLTAIVKIPGVGKKTAERLLIEMRDKLTDWQTSTTDTTLPAIDLAIAPSDERNDRMVQADAITALVSLGYTQQQATKAVKSVFQPDYTSEQLIRDALKSML
jgi:Holliday junction DNA helicase RuvA